MSWSLELDIVATVAAAAAWAFWGYTLGSRPWAGQPSTDEDPGALRECAAKLERDARELDLNRFYEAADECRKRARAHRLRADAIERRLSRVEAPPLPKRGYR